MGVSVEFSGPSLGESDVTRDGVYRMESIPKGPTELFATVDYQDDQHRMVSRPIEITDGQVITVDFDIAESTGSVEGLVLPDAGDTGVMVVYAVIETLYGTDRVGILVNEDGAFKVDHVAAGEGELEAMVVLRSGQMIQGTVPITVTDGESL
ncbi:MAG: hypothetical protein QGG73_08480, partial [Candidatus Hydrogenedentes bacterium]|nr:hypothetical protein [Candidatus Hydrogenedentota bacterium]